MVNKEENKTQYNFYILIHIYTYSFVPQFVIKGPDFQHRAKFLQYMKFNNQKYQLKLFFIQLLYLAFDEVGPFTLV